MNLKELAERVDMPVPRLLNLRQKFGLKDSGSYSPGYAVIIKKLIYLSACDVPQHAIKTLLTREKTLLELLKVDSVDHSPAWFENLCTDLNGPTRLLLSGYDTGSVSDVQPGLDFREHAPELFSHREMGADILYAFARYREASAKVRGHLAAEIPQMIEALTWGRRVLHASYR